MSKRYIVEERIGCVAVMDTDKMDINAPGLHRDTSGVVKYWQGVWTDEQWTVPEHYLKESQVLCDQLNEGDLDAV